MKKNLSIQLALLLLATSANASSEYNETAPKMTFEKCKRHGGAEVLLPKGDCARLTETETGAEVVFETVEVEKCYGIARAGENDGIDGQDDGAKKATADNDSMAWIDLPLHTCGTLGGSLEAQKAVPSEEEAPKTDV